MYLWFSIGNVLTYYFLTYSVVLMYNLEILVKLLIFGYPELKKGVFIKRQYVRSDLIHKVITIYSD